MQKNKNQNSAYVYAIIAVLIWATVASAFKISLRYLDSWQLLLLASFVSVITLGTILFVQKKFNQLKTYSKRDYLKSALSGFLNPFLYYVLLFKAYSLLPAQEAQPLNYTWPIMLVLLSIPLLGQRIGVKSILALVVSFIGVFVISTQGNIVGFHFTNTTGALFALSTAIIWALFWILNKKDNRDEIPKLFLNFIFGFFYILMATILFSKIPTPSIQGILGALYVGLFEMGITFVIWSKALSLSETTAKVSKLVYLTPFLSLIVIYFLVGEKILLSTVIGLLFIVAGIILEQISNAQKKIT